MPSVCTTNVCVFASLLSLYSSIIFVDFSFPIVCFSRTLHICFCLFPLFACDSCDSDTQKRRKRRKWKKKWKKGFKWAPFAGDAMCAKRKMAAGHVNAAKRCRPLEIQADQQQQLRWIMNERGLGGEWRRGHKKYCCILMRACRCGSFIRNPHPHPLPSWHLKPQPGLRSTKLLYFCHNFQIIHILCMQQSLRCMSEWVSVRLCEMSLRMLLWQVEGVAVRS